MRLVLRVLIHVGEFTSSCARVESSDSSSVNREDWDDENRPMCPLRMDSPLDTSLLVDVKGFNVYLGSSQVDGWT